MPSVLEDRDDLAALPRQPELDFTLGEFSKETVMTRPGGVSYTVGGAAAPTLSSAPPTFCIIAQVL